MSKYIKINRRQMFVIGTIFLIFATILITIVAGIYDFKIPLLQRKYEEKIDSYDKSNILWSSSDISEILRRIDLLESSILLEFLRNYTIKLTSKEEINNIPKILDDYNDRTYLKRKTSFLKREISDYYQMINLPEFQTKRDSIQNQKIIIMGLDIPYSEQDSLLLQLVNLSEALFKKQQVIKAEEIKKMSDKIGNLHGMRMAFYVLFVHFQVMALILIGYSQIMKDNK